MCDLHPIGLYASQVVEGCSGIERQGRYRVETSVAAHELTAFCPAA
jgi:hypothetical protein